MMRSKVNVQKILKLNPQCYDFTNTTSYLLPKNELSNSNEAHTPWNVNDTVQALCVCKISSTYRHAFRTSAELGYMDTDIDGMI